MSQIAVAKVANVTISSSPTFPARKGFGLLNIIGISAILPLGERARSYSDMDDVAVDFPSNSEEYKAAQVGFSQKPRVTELMISRRFASAAPGELLGAAVPVANLTTLTAIANGGFDIAIDGVVKKLTGIDMTAQTTFNGIATVLQTKLSVASAGTTCVWDGSRFIVRSGTTGITSTIGYAAVASGTGTPTDISVTIGLTTGTKTTGIAAETIATALSAIQDFNQSWYGYGFTNEVTTQNVKDAMAWAQARVKIFGYTSSDASIADSSSTTDLAYYGKANLYDRSFLTFDNDDPYQWVSAACRMFTVNFNNQNSTSTLKFKQLPGTTPVNITETQRKVLVSKNCNYYTYFGESAMIAEGVMCDGTFFDERHGLDWLQNAIETNVFGFLYTRQTKVPQTDRGVQLIVQQVEKALQEGVNNGLLAPGTWEGEDLGTVKSGDFLKEGYYAFAQAVADQNQSDREARIAPPIQALACGAGAIHFANIAVNFQR